MTPERIAELLRQIPTLATLDECQGFRDQLKAQGETMAAEVYGPLRDRMDVLARREGKR